MTTTDNTSIKAPHEAILDLPQERITGDILRGRGPRRGNLERLIKYWRPIMRKPGGFRRCLVILADHPELYPLERICAWLHHETTGLWPNEGNHHAGGKLGPIVKRTVKKKKRRRRGKNLEIVGGVDYPIDRVERRLDRLSGSTRFKMLDGSEGQLQFKSDRVTRIGRAVESVLLPGERGALKPRHLLRTSLTPGGSGLPGPKLAFGPKKPGNTRGFRCPPGFERGGHFTDSRLSTCGHQLFGIPGSSRSTITTIAAAANNQPTVGKAEPVPEPKEAPTPGIGGGMPTLPDTVGRPNEELQMENLGKLVGSMGAIKNPTDKPIRRMVREDGSILQPMAPLDILAKQKDNPDMRNAAFLTKVDGPGPIGSDELPLMPIGLKSLDYALPGGGRVSLKRTGGLMPPGKARAFGKAVAAARREPVDEMNYADLFQKIVGKTDAVTLEIDTPGEGDSNKVVMVKGPDGEKKVPYWVYETFLAGDAPGKPADAAPYTMVGEAPAEEPMEEKALNDFPHEQWGPLQYTAALIPDYDEIDHTIGVAFKASAYKAYQRDITWAFIQEKRASSVWDRGMERFRCPPGSVNGGQITNRLGIGCGAAVVQRIGRLFGQTAEVVDNAPTPGRARAAVTPNRPGRRDRVPGDARVGPVDISPDLQNRIVDAVQGGEARSVLAPDQRRSQGGVRGRIADMLDSFALNVDVPADELEDAVLQSRRARDLDAEEAERVAAEAAAAQRVVAQREAQARRAQEVANRIQEETERVAREAQLEEERAAIERSRAVTEDVDDVVQTVGDPVDFNPDGLVTGYTGSAQLREVEGEYFIDVDMRNPNGDRVGVVDPEGPFASRAEAVEYLESMTGGKFTDPDATPNSPDFDRGVQIARMHAQQGYDDYTRGHLLSSDVLHVAGAAPDRHERGEELRRGYLSIMNDPNDPNDVRPAPVIGPDEVIDLEGGFRPYNPAEPIAGGPTPDATPDVTPDATPDVPESPARSNEVLTRAQTMFGERDRGGLQSLQEQQLNMANRAGRIGNEDERRQYEQRAGFVGNLIARLDDEPNPLSATGSAPEFTGGSPPRPADAPRVRTAVSDPFRDRDNSLPYPRRPEGRRFDTADIDVEQRRILLADTVERRAITNEFWGSRLHGDVTTESIDTYTRQRLANPDILPGQRNTILRRREDWAFFERAGDDEEELIEFANFTGDARAREMLDSSGIRPIRRRRRGSDPVPEVTATPGNGMTLPGEGPVTSTVTNEPWVLAPEIAERARFSETTNLGDAQALVGQRFPGGRGDLQIEIDRTLNNLRHQRNLFDNGGTDNPDQLLAAMADATEAHALAMVLVGNESNVIGANRSIIPGMSLQQAISQIGSDIGSGDPVMAERVADAMATYAGELGQTSLLLRSRGIELGRGGNVGDVVNDANRVARVNRVIRREIQGREAAAARNPYAARTEEVRHYAPSVPGSTAGPLFRVKEDGSGFRLNDAGFASIFRSGDSGEIEVPPKTWTRMSAITPKTGTREFEAQYHVSGNRLTVETREIGGHGGGYVHLDFKPHWENGQFDGRVYVDAHLAGFTQDSQNLGLAEAIGATVMNGVLMSSSFGQMDTHANLNVGIYAWASKGFDFTDGQTPSYVKQNARRLAEWLRDPTNSDKKDRASAIVYGALWNSLGGKQNTNVPGDQVANVMASYLVKGPDILESLDKIATEGYTEASEIAGLGRRDPAYPVAGQNALFHPGRTLFMSQNSLGRGWFGTISFDPPGAAEYRQSQIVDPTA